MFNLHFLRPFQPFGNTDSSSDVVTRPSVRMLPDMRDP